MLRFLVYLLLAAAFGGPAHAFSPEGASASFTDFGGRHGFSLGISGVDSMGTANREERPLQMRVATLGLTWARDGWSVALAGGRMQYVITGILQGSALLTGLTISREVTGIAGGSLTAELRAHRLQADDGSTDLLAAALRWTLRF
jgi:hypothetical protein